MMIVKCNKCLDVVYNSEDERRYKIHHIINREVLCEDCLEEKKEDIIGNIYDDLFPEINQLINKVMKKQGKVNGELLCSKNLDYEYRETFEKLSRCIFKQLLEN